MKQLYEYHLKWCQDNGHQYLIEDLYIIQRLANAWNGLLQKCNNNNNTEIPIEIDGADIKIEITDIRGIFLVLFFF